MDPGPHIPSSDAGNRRMGEACRVTDDCGATRSERCRLGQIAPKRWSTKLQGPRVSTGPPGDHASINARTSPARQYQRPDHRRLLISAPSTPTATVDAWGRTILIGKTDRQGGTFRTWAFRQTPGSLKKTKKKKKQKPRRHDSPSLPEISRVTVKCLDAFVR